jgi:protein TonB
MDAVLDFGFRHGRKLLILVAAVAHLAVIALVSFKMPAAATADTEAAEVFKMVDAREYVPPPKIEELPPPEETVTVPVQSQAAATVVETEKMVVESPTAAAYVPVERPVEDPIDFLPQHKISRVPVIPTEKVLSRIKYPELAAKQGIEGVVYLELYIDKTGRIRNVVVLKDPGFGFAEAALEALEGLSCQPAAANGEAVAVKFRYPVRFTLKK